jgi:hypothetical protein
VLAAVNLQLRQQIAELQQSAILLARQLEREIRCEACQKARSVVSMASAVDGAGSSLYRAAGSRVASLLGHLQGNRSKQSIDALLREVGRDSEAPGLGGTLPGVHTTLSAVQMQGQGQGLASAGRPVSILPKWAPPNDKPGDVSDKSGPGDERKSPTREIKEGDKKNLQTLSGAKRKSPEREITPRIE